MGRVGGSEVPGVGSSAPCSLWPVREVSCRGSFQDPEQMERRPLSLLTVPDTVVKKGPYTDCHLSSSNLRKRQICWIQVTPVTEEIHKNVWFCSKIRWNGKIYKSFRMVFWHTPCCLVLSTPGLERLDRLAQLNWTSSGQRLVFYSWNRLSLLPSSSAPGWKASHCPEVAGLKYYINSHCGEIVQDIFLISLWFMSLSQLKPLIFGIS